MTRREFLLSVAAGTLLAACGSTAPAATPSSPPAGSPGPSGRAASGAGAASAAAKPSASAQASSRLNAAYASVSTTQATAWISEGAGLFKKQGLDVSMTFISPATLTAGVLSGQLDFAYGPANSLAAVAAQGGDMITVGGPYDGPSFAMVASASVKDLKDLKGKKISVTQRGSSGDLLVSDLMKKQGFAPSDYSVVYIPDAAQQVAALSSGAVDALVSGEPTASIAVAQGGHTVFAATDSQGQYITISCILLRKSFLASHRDELKRVLAANIEAGHMLKANPDGVAQYVAPYLKLDDLAIVRASLKQTLPNVVEGMRFSLDDFQKLLAETATTVPGVASLKPGDLVDFSLLDELSAGR
jgi:NitT/TauT family transport system substrate-binding protein